MPLALRPGVYILGLWVEDERQGLLSWDVLRAYPLQQVSLKLDMYVSFVSLETMSSVSSLLIWEMREITKLEEVINSGVSFPRWPHREGKVALYFSKDTSLYNDLSLS